MCEVNKRKEDLFDKFAISKYIAWEADLTASGTIEVVWRF